MLNAHQKFKATPVGDIPVDWECVPLTEVTNTKRPIKYGIVQTGDSNSGTTPCLRVTDLSSERIEKSKLIKTTEEIHKANPKTILQQGDIVFALRGDVGNVQIIDEKLEGCNLTRGVALISPIPENFSNLFLLYAIQCPATKKKIEVAVNGTSLKEIPIGSLKKIPIVLPPLIEQQKIADILGTWDRAIDTQQKLITALTQRKKALAQQLLTGKTRLPGFEEPWEEIRLGDHFKRVTKKNTDGHTQVVTISAQQGLVSQQDFFNKQIASTILDNYYVLGKGQFAYNKSYSKGYPMGAIKRLNRYDYGVVTTLYICFALKSPEATESDFWEHYFESGALNRGITRIAHEGGRAHGLLNVTPKDFFELPIQSPTLSEQTAIAKVLTTADRELALHTQHLTTLQTQKRALMQKLLTGKVRVAN